MRESWGASYNKPDIVMPLVFMIGKSTDTTDVTLQKQMVSENNIYKDIIQADFEDTYLNSTTKTLIAYRWVRHHCSQAKYVLVANDDVVIDIFKLIPYLESYQNQNDRQILLCHFYPCCMLADKPKPPSGSEVSSILPYMYRGKAYPSYCSASAYVTSSNVIQTMYLMSKDTPLFVPEDPYLGVLSEKLGVPLKDTSSSFVGLDGPLSLMNLFNDSNYLDQPTMVGVITNNFPHREVGTPY